MPARALTAMTLGVQEDVSMIELEVLAADVTKLAFSRSGRAMSRRSAQGSLRRPER